MNINGNVIFELKVLKEKYPEDIGADAVGYDQDGDEFGIRW